MVVPVVLVGTLGSPRPLLHQSGLPVWMLSGSAPCPDLPCLSFPGCRMRLGLAVSVPVAQGPWGGRASLSPGERRRSWAPWASPDLLGGGPASPHPGYGGVQQRSGGTEWSSLRGAATSPAPQGPSHPARVPWGPRFPPPRAAGTPLRQRRVSAGDSWGIFAFLCAALCNLPAVPALNGTEELGAGQSIQKTYDLTRYLEHQLRTLAGTYVSRGLTPPPGLSLPHLPVGTASLGTSCFFLRPHQHGDPPNLSMVQHRDRGGGAPVCMRPWVSTRAGGQGNASSQVQARARASAHPWLPATASPCPPAAPAHAEVPCLCPDVPPVLLAWHSWRCPGAIAVRPPTACTLCLSSLGCFCCWAVGTRWVCLGGGTWRPGMWGLLGLSWG